ncbi:MAG: S8 family serine peptidase [Deltaproteobacteria bacterium]|nr:S8 family serine peptidase [Deltaproteobacteria bacterium]MBW2723708.1 S8 family serine peptidase [Deltaproteobacteria bacterium]
MNPRAEIDATANLAANVTAQSGRPVEPRALTLVAVSLLLVTGLSQAQAAQSNRDTRSERVHAALAEPIPQEGLAISVVLREPVENSRPMRPGVRRRARVAARQERVLRALPKAAYLLRRQFREICGFTAWADPDAIAILAAHPEVVSIDLDRELHASLAQGVPLIGGVAAHVAGLTGTGVTVAMIDTGFDSDHPDLQNVLIAEACFCDDGPPPGSGCCPDATPLQIEPGAAEDDNGHGTEMSGVIASSDGINTGIAPDAKIIAVKVLDSTGNGVASDVAAGLDWVLSDGIGLGVSVVNISISDELEYDDDSVAPCAGSNTSAAISALHAAGVVVFASSGNDAYSSGISFPACVSDAVAVASVYDANFGEVNFGICDDTPAVVDTIPCHASTGSLLDLLAPGAVTNTPQLGGGQAGEAGTSIASAYAAGQAALLIEADLSLTPSQIRNLMLTNGPMILDLDNGLSFPRTDIEDALIALPEPSAALGLITGALFLALAKHGRTGRGSA